MEDRHLHTPDTDDPASAGKPFGIHNHPEYRRLRNRHESLPPQSANSGWVRGQTSDSISGVERPIRDDCGERRARRRVNNKAATLKRLAGGLLAIFLAVVVPVAAQSETVTVATLDWPPYTSASLPLGGATTEVVRQAFAKAGINIKVSYLPWKRAIESAKNTSGVVAYYPGYHCHHVPGFVASKPIGNGPLGFAENVDHPVTWTSDANLVAQHLKIGTVLGYANTDQFDAEAKAGVIHAVPAPDDATNLRKLAYGRIDLAVIDKLVMSYLLATEPSLKGDDKILKFNARPLANKTLYICFNDTPSGRALRDRFDKGLAQVDAAAIVDRYFKEQF